jgi:hypothetical protein
MNNGPCSVREMLVHLGLGNFSTRFNYSSVLASFRESVVQPLHEARYFREIPGRYTET